MTAVEPPCRAPGQSECSTFAHMDMVFWVNQVINFSTYAEPCFWATILVIRVEIVGQSEGPSTTSFQRLRKGPALPAEGWLESYNCTGAALLCLAFGATGVASTVLKAQS